MTNKNYKIPIEELKNLWENEGTWGKWRDLLKTGYESNETYFEFGLMPNIQDSDFIIVVNHIHEISLNSGGLAIGNSVITPSNQRVGTQEIIRDKIRKPIIYYVSREFYQNIIDEARQIFEEYKNEETICFWSIPNKWFDNTNLVGFIQDNIVLKGIKDNWPRKDWYWP